MCVCTEKITETWLYTIWFWCNLRFVGVSRWMDDIWRFTFECYGRSSHLRTFCRRGFPRWLYLTCGALSCLKSLLVGQRSLGLETIRAEKCTFCSWPIVCFQDIDASWCSSLVAYCTSCYNLTGCHFWGFVLLDVCSCGSPRCAVPILQEMCDEFYFPRPRSRRWCWSWHSGWSKHSATSEKSFSNKNNVNDNDITGTI